MKISEDLHDNPTQVSTSDWWRSRRRHYNVGLIYAGISAFLVYCVVLAIFDPITRDTQDIEFTPFTLLFEAVSFLLCMGIANICYFLGPLSERWLHPKHPEKYRRTAFALGFWISVALPFFFPALLAFLALFHPQQLSE